VIQISVLNEACTATVGTITQGLVSGVPDGVTSCSAPQETLNEVGGGSITLQADSSFASLIQLDHPLRIEPINAAGSPNVWFTIDPTRIRTVHVSPDGEAGQIITIEGAGLLGRLAKSPVLARTNAPFSPRRDFGWMSPELDTAAWVAPNVRGVIGDRTAAPPLGLNGVPVSSPNPLVQFLWGQAPTGSADPAGTCYFHTTFTTSQTERVTFYPLYDDLGWLAINGVIIEGLSDPSARAASTQMYRTVTLPAGTHTVRARVENVGSGAVNPGLFALAVTRDISATVWGIGGIATIEYIEGTAPGTFPGWVTLPYPATPPGLTPGRILRILLEEAQARGELSGWTLAFTDVNDSSGTPWAPIPEFSVDLGTSFLDVLRQMASLGYIDFAAPIGLGLSCWAARGTIASTPIPSTDLLSYETTVDQSGQVDKITAGYALGTVTVGTGERAAWMSTSAETASEAFQIATDQIASLNAPETSISLRWDDGGVDAITPTIGFNVGDTITTSEGSGRISSITLDYPSTSETREWTVELATPRREFLDRQARLIARMGRGGIGGRSEAIAPATPGAPEPKQVTTEVLTWGLDASPVPEMSLAAPGHGRSIKITARTAPAAPVTLTLTVNGAAVTIPGPALTLPTGQTEAVFSTTPLYGSPSVRFGWDISGAPASASGLAVEMIAVQIP
jgi:hypothetical protein